MIDTLVERNNIKIIGNGNVPMIFLHGYGCDQQMWRFVYPAFEDHYKIILMDHVGSGKSNVEAYDFNKYSSLNGYANDLLEIIDAFQLQETIIVAHSGSAMIALLAAAERPSHFSKLVLLGPSPCYINKPSYDGGFSQDDIDELVSTLESNYLGWSSFITPVIIGDDNQKEYSEELKNSFCSMNPAIAKHFAKVTFLSDNRGDLKRVKTPALIIQTNPDVIAPVQVGQYVHQNVLGSTYIELQTIGHCPHLTAPNEVISAINQYLNF
ncbi:MAG: alpha/beta fold hydrolase [Mongoliitalea sp.]